MIEQKSEGETAHSSLRRYRLPITLGVVLLVVAFVLGGCGPLTFSTATQDYPADVAQDWFDLSLQLVKDTPGFTPPVASRAIGYLGVTLYETVRPGMFRYSSLEGQLNELWDLPKVEWFRSYHWPTAANAAMAAILRQLFPTATPEDRVAIDTLEEKYTQEYMATVDTLTYQRSVAWGQAVAAAIYNWSLTDGGHEGYTRNFPADYVPPVGPGLWVPTAPKYQSALQPYWGDNRPFVLTDGEECPAPLPVAYSEDPNSEFYAQAREVYDTVLSGDPKHVAIANFWADDPGRTSTPPGHWISILNQVLDNEDANLAMAAESYAKLGIAVADAFITCWRTKYIYNVVRPISYIQAVIDPAWNTPEITDPVMTPPFPEYPSGHSVQSGAAAVVLSSLFGVDYAFTDNTRADLGLPPRTFTSFEAAADEAAISRLYGGIHFRAAIENGLTQGRCVGDRVLQLHFGPQ